MSQSPDTERDDEALARTAHEKKLRGQQPTAREAAALRRVKQRLDDEAARRHYARMPKRIYRELSGRKDKVILEQAAQYGIPIGGPEVDLGAVLRWLHDSIAAGKFKPLGGAGGESFDWMPDAQKSRLGEEQIRKTRAQADILELEREEKEKTLIPREAVFGLHSQIAGVFRTFADRLQKTFGLEARKMFLETIDAAERKINGLLADPGEPAADNSPDQHGSIGADNSNATHPAEVSGGDSV